MIRVLQKLCAKIGWYIVILPSTWFNKFSYNRCERCRQPNPNIYRQFVFFFLIFKVFILLLLSSRTVFYQFQVCKVATGHFRATPSAHRGLNLQTAAPTGCRLQRCYVSRSLKLWKTVSYMRVYLLTVSGREQLIIHTRNWMYRLWNQSKSGCKYCQVIPQSADVFNVSIFIYLKRVMYFNECLWGPTRSLEDF